MRALSCHELCYRRQSVATGQPENVLADIEATFEPESITLISGLTGAGKSTLLHLMAGLLRPTAGEIRWGDAPISRWHSSHKDRWRRQVGIVFQHQQLLPDLSAGENALLPLIPRRMSLQDQATAVETALARVDLSAKASSKAVHLSGGERQRLAIARAIAPQPAILLIDEPSAFQDDHQTEGLINLFREEKQRGAVVVACSHDPRLRSAVWADHCYRLERGRLEAAP